MRQPFSAMRNAPRSDGIDDPLHRLPVFLGAVSGSWRAAVEDRWMSWRNALVSSPVFRRRAAAFPLTRPTARRHASRLFDIVAGFVYSQVMLACVQLDVFTVLADGPKEAATMARLLRLPVDAATRLLDAAVSLELLQKRRDGRYALATLGAAMVGNNAVAAMVRHHGALYADLADPVELLRSGGGNGELARYWPYAANRPPSEVAIGGGSPGPDDARVVEGGRHAPASTSASNPDADLEADRAATYTALMSASQPLVTEEILDAFSLAGRRCLLDVGGGDGTFLIAAGQRYPELQLRLFDLPPVADIATARFAQAGMASRARASRGSFLEDELPRGADVATLVRVIHDHDDASAMTILRAVHAALPAGGCLLLAEPMAGTRGSEAMGDAYFGFYLLAMGRGRPRTEAALVAMLTQAGFLRTRAIPTRMPMQTRLLVATRA